MAERRHITEPGETIHLPQPSWAPAFLAFGLLGVVCGIFAAGFIFSPYIYSIIGAIIAIAALGSLIRGASGAYFRLPRRQRVRGSALPIQTITFPPDRR